MLGDLPSCAHPSEYFTLPFIALGQNHCATFAVVLLILRRSRGALEPCAGFHSHSASLPASSSPVWCHPHWPRGAWKRLAWSKVETHTKLSITIVRSLSQTKKAVKQQRFDFKVQGHQQKVSRLSSGSNKTFQGRCQITT